MSDVPIVCTLEAIPEGQRNQHQTSSQTLFAQIQAITELPDGYQLAFPVELLVPLAKFIALERLCCPFWDFTLRVPPGGKQIFYEGTLAELVATNPAWHALFDTLLTCPRIMCQSE